MAEWRIQEHTRRYHNSEYDLIDVHVIYSAVTALNTYRIGKDETTIPRHLLEERKWGETRNLDGSDWIEGTLKGGRRR